jgi:hypothetical protein
MQRGIRQFAYSVDAKMTMSNVTSYAVGFFLVGILMPIGLEAIYASNTTGWDPTVKTVFQLLLPTLAVIGIGVDYIRGPD